MIEKEPVIVFGSLAYDELYRYSGVIRDHLPGTEDTPLYINIRAKGPEIRRGGCGGNLAYTLGSLDIPATLHSWLGGDGGEYADFLRNHGIDTNALIHDDSKSTPRAVLISDTKNDHFLVFSTQDIPTGWHLPGHGSYSLAVVTAGIPETTGDICAWLADHRIPYILDPGKFILDVHPPSLIKHLKYAESVVLNEYEVDLLVKHCTLSLEDIVSSGTVLVVTRGEGGSTLYRRGTEDESIKKESIPAIKPQRFVDPSGAGDAFLAGYAAGRYAGYDHLWASRMGSAAASFALEWQGAQEHETTMKQCLDRMQSVFGKPK